MINFVRAKKGSFLFHKKYVSSEFRKKEESSLFDVIKGGLRRRFKFH